MQAERPVALRDAKGTHPVSVTFGDLPLTFFCRDRGNPGYLLEVGLELVLLP